MNTTETTGVLRPRLIAGACFAALLALGACNPTSSKSEPAAVEQTEIDESRFSEEGLQNLDDAMRQAVESGEVVGLSYVLVSGEEEIARNYFGLASTQTNAPIQEDTIYRIYSMSKPITGVAMMMLWEQGLWDLDDPVTDYIPEFENLRVLDGMNEDGTPRLVDANRPPTMREVMSHQAWFAYGLGGTDMANEAFRERRILREPDLDSFIDAIADVPLLFQPGDDWYYSAAVDVQGYIVEKLSGQRFGEFLDENIFTPLGMDDTGFFVPEADYDRLSDVFTFSQDYDRLVTVPTLETRFREDTVPMESGGGGLVATLDDYKNFCQMMLNGGELNGHRIIREDTVELMRTNVLGPDMELWSNGNAGRATGAEGHGFGLDFGIVMDPSATGTGQGPGTYYWGGAAGTWFWIDPATDLYFIGMIQLFAGDPESQFDPRGASREAVYDALVE